MEKEKENGKENVDLIEAVGAIAFKEVLREILTDDCARRYFETFRGLVRYIAKNHTDEEIFTLYRKANGLPEKKASEKEKLTVSKFNRFIGEQIAKSDGEINRLYDELDVALSEEEEREIKEKIEGYEIEEDTFVYIRQKINELYED